MIPGGESMRRSTVRVVECEDSGGVSRRAVSKLGMLEFRSSKKASPSVKGASVDSEWTFLTMRLVKDIQMS